MFYDDEPQYYQPSIADDLLMEYQNKMKDALLESVKSMIENIKEENEELKEENKKLRDAKYQVDNKERALIEKEKTLDRDFYRKKFSELLKPFEEKYSGYYADKIYRLVKKCKHCDENRKITYLAENGCSIIQNCSCNKSYQVYVPKYTSIEKLDLYKPKDNYHQEFKITAVYHSKDEDDYRWTKLEFTQFIDVFDELIANEMKGRDVLFNSKEECKKYCNWLNKNIEIDED